MCPEGFNPRFSILKHFSKTRPQLEFGSSIGYIRDLTLNPRFDRLRGAGERCWHQRYDDRETQEERESSPTPSETCKYDAVGSDESSEEGEHSVCGCATCTKEMRDGDWSDNPSFYEEHFLDFCRRFSTNALRSFRYA